MGFLFRIEQMSVKDDATLLTGRLLSGHLNWGQRVEIQSSDETNPAFEAPLRGVALVDHDVRSELMSLDPSCWDACLALPIAANKEKRVRLVLDGVPPLNVLGPSVPGIAVGIDVPRTSRDDDLQHAIRSTASTAAMQTRALWLAGRVKDAPPLPGLGTPVREYSYRFSRGNILLFAPWFLLLTLAIPVVVFFVALRNGTLAEIDFGKWISFALFGLVDVFLLSISFQMLISKSSQIVVTTTGIVLPIFLPGFASEDVFVSFLDLEDMLEYWHLDSLQLIKLKTPQGALSIHGLLMQPPQFEELRRLLWKMVLKGQSRPDLSTHARIPH